MSSFEGTMNRESEEFMEQQNNAAGVRKDEHEEILEQQQVVTGAAKLEHHEETESEHSDDAKGDRMSWDESFKRLLAFREKHGHCRVPNRYKEDPRLGSWVSAQRRIYKLNGMTAERVKQLEETGFEWTAKDPRHVPWDSRYQELVDFKSKYGHSQVPIGWKENPQLSNWVSTQRQEYKLLLKGRVSRLTDERIQKLEKVDFIWEAQRGGPRRQKRATVCVPAKATPAARGFQRPEQAGRHGRGGMRAVGSSALVDTRGGEDMAEGLAERALQANTAPQSVTSNQAQAIAQFSRAQAAALLARQQASSMSSQALANGGLLGAQQLGNIQAAGGPSSGVTQVIPQQQAFPFLPGGAMQQPMGLGIFPIATPLNVAAAGYQLGMIPTSMLQGQSSTLQGAQAAGGAQQSSKKKRKKKRKKSKKKKKRRRKEEEDKEDSSSSSDSDSSSSSDNDDDDEEENK